MYITNTIQYDNKGVKAYGFERFLFAIHIFSISGELHVELSVGDRPVSDKITES